MANHELIKIILRWLTTARCYTILHHTSTYNYLPPHKQKQYVQLKMAVRHVLDQKLPVLSSTIPVGYCLKSFLSKHTGSPVYRGLTKAQWKWKTVKFRALARRLVLGLGASFWTSFVMNSSSSTKHFVASARQKGAVEEVLKNVEWPEQLPFKEEDFQRFDESPDSLFYESPRFVTHIDDPAIAALTKYYSEVFPPSNTPGVSMLDMCSSWVSHFPKGYKQDRVVGMGMNEEELKQNPVLTEYIVQDLNLNPKLPFEDNSFDVITNVVSVDYLTKPIDVFKEMSRVLKPGGLAIMSFSNRCFWTKAISIWTSTSDADHVLIVGSYFHYAGGFEPPQAVDISPNPGRSDPMYIVYSRKASVV